MRLVLRAVREESSLSRPTLKVSGEARDSEGRGGEGDMDTRGCCRPVGGTEQEPRSYLLSEPWPRDRGKARATTTASIRQGRKWYLLPGEVPVRKPGRTPRTVPGPAGHRHSDTPPGPGDPPLFHVASSSSTCLLMRYCPGRARPTGVSPVSMWPSQALGLREGDLGWSPGTS